LADTEFNSDDIKKNGQPEESLLGTQNSITFEQPKNYSLQILPLGDINMKLEDIIPCTYKYLKIK